MRSRQLEILLYLMETKKTTYAELANHFEVSKKTIIEYEVTPHVNILANVGHAGGTGEV